MPTTLKGQLQAYFNGNGFERWSAIYGRESVSKIRLTVREGHEKMLATAEQWLLASHTEGSLLDAGCGTGLFSIRAAQQGFDVTAVDLAPKMIEAAHTAATAASVGDHITFKTGDIEEAIDSTFDAVVCFDVLVHYPRESFSDMCTFLAKRSRGSLIMTYAPYSHFLAALHWIGGRFPKKERRTTIQMTPDSVVDEALAKAGKSITQKVNIDHGFYHVRLIEAK